MPIQEEKNNIRPRFQIIEEKIETLQIKHMSRWVICNKFWKENTKRLSNHDSNEELLLPHQTFKTFILHHYRLAIITRIKWCADMDVSHILQRSPLQYDVQPYVTTMTIHMNSNMQTKICMVEGCLTRKYRIWKH